jgi:23S rRNA pseudouridine2605 synthase
VIEELEIHAPILAADAPNQDPMRLAKYLAHSGVASRRAAERTIRDGRVTVAGEVVLDPALDVDEHVAVAVDGCVLDGPEGHVVYAVNKPLGVLSTAKDTHGRPTVVDLLADADGRLLVPFRVYPVGRLDSDSSGLILLTNDGALAHRLTHPSFEVGKTYRARVGGGPVGDRELKRLREGVRLEDGMTAPARVKRVGRGMLELTIHEGRNRQVRRMCEAVGHPVQELRRVAFGPLKLGDLALGAHRRLADAEVESLRDLSGGGN